MSPLPNYVEVELCRSIIRSKEHPYLGVLISYDISKEVVTLVKMVPSLSPVSYWWNTMVTASLSSEVSSSTAVLPPARRRPSFLPKLFCSMWAGPEGGGGVGAGSSTTLILA